MPTNRDVYKPKFTKEEAQTDLENMAKYFASHGIPSPPPKTPIIKDNWSKRYWWDGYWFRDVNLYEREKHTNWWYVYQQYLFSYPVAFPKLIEYYGGIQAVNTGNQIDAVGNALNDEVINDTSDEPIITDVSEIPDVVEINYAIPIAIAIGIGLVLL